MQKINKLNSRWDSFQVDDARGKGIPTAQHLPDGRFMRNMEKRYGDQKVEKETLEASNQKQDVSLVPSPQYFYDNGVLHSVEDSSHGLAESAQKSYLKVVDNLGFPAFIVGSEVANGEPAQDEALGTNDKNDVDAFLLRKYIQELQKTALNGEQ